MNLSIVAPSRTTLIVGVFVVLALFAAMSGFDGREPIASAETRFVELSESGLQIVPASCASIPPFEHFSGECSIDACPNIPDFQMSGPCIVDVCPDVAGIQVVGPCGGGDTPIDVCPNDPGVQASGPCSSCPLGFGGAPPNCIFIGCPSGTYLVNGACETVDCPLDTIFNPVTGLCEFQNQCVPNNQCGSGLTESMVVNSCTGAIIDNCTARGPGWFCNNGQCIANQPTGNIWVQPPRVRSGSPTMVRWETHNMIDCSVSENNPTISDFWPSELNGAHPSSDITQRTTYTLSCTTNTGQPFTDRATVNVIPVFIEL